MRVVARSGAGGKRSANDKVSVIRPGQLSVMALALAAALASPGWVMAQTQIAGGSTQFTFTSGDAVLGGGTVLSVSSGAAVYTDSIVGTLTNNGSINGYGTFFRNPAIAVDVPGDATAIYNTSTGTLSGETTGLANYGHIGLLHNTGTIISTGSIGVRNEVDSTGTVATIGTLQNSRLIEGAAVGIENNSATIGNAVIGTLANSGTINGVTSRGVNNIGGTISLIDNQASGTIMGGVTGLYSTGSIGALVNSGLIQGGTIGVANGSGGVISSLQNTGVVSGSLSGISNSGTISTLTNGTLGTINGVGSSGVNVGISNSGLVSSLLNNGLINGIDYGISISNTGTISNINNNTGIISGEAVALISNGVVGTLLNSSSIVGGTIGISNSGGVITQLTNNGTVSGSLSGISNSGTISTLTNGTLGTINGVGSSGVNVGISNAGLVSSLQNSGVIHGSDYGISSTGTITSLTNTAGTISGDSTGIYTNGAIGTLTNSGVINGVNGLVNNGSGTINSVINNASITGTTRAVSNAGAIGTLRNASGATISGATAIWNQGSISAIHNLGTIISTGGSGLAISNTSAGTMGVISNSGVIAGSIVNASSTGLTIAGGGGSTFGTLTGINGSIGNISNTAANMAFSSGNVLLNDHIDVGSNTVMSGGVALRVDNHITITGNYQQGSAASLVIGVASGAANAGVVGDTGYGRLIVTGSAVFTAGSGVTLTPVTTYTFAQGQRYLVAQAATSGTNYNASSLNYSVTGYTGAITGSVVNDSTTSSLLVVLGAGSSGGGGAMPNNFATTGNAVSAISGLFNYNGANASLLNVFNAAAALGSTGEANKAGAQLTPASNAMAATQASTAPTQNVLNVAAAHVDGLRVAQAQGSGVATGEEAGKLAMWGQAFGGEATQNQRNNVSGYHSKYNGLLIGGDWLLNPAWRVGGLVSYATTSVAGRDDNSGSSVSLKSYGLIGYGGYTADTWYLDLSGGVVRHKYDSTRLMNFTGFSGVANGNYQGTQSVLTAQGGYPIQLDARTVLTPIAGLNYSKLKTDGYTESGGSGAALKVDANKATSLTSDLGVKLERSFTTGYGSLAPSAQLTWRHEYQDTRLRSVASYAADTSGATSFVTYGAKPSANTGIMALGMTLTRSDNLTVTARYTLEAAAGYKAQTADVRLRYQF